MHIHNNIKTFHTATYKEKTNNNKHWICQLYYELQKEVKSNPAVKKVGGPKNAVVKKDVKSKVAAKKWLWW